MGAWPQRVRAVSGIARLDRRPRIFGVFVRQIERDGQAIGLGIGGVDDRAQHGIAHAAIAFEADRDRTAFAHEAWQGDPFAVHQARLRAPIDGLHVHAQRQRAARGGKLVEVDDEIGGTP